MQSKINLSISDNCCNGFATKESTFSFQQVQIASMQSKIYNLCLLTKSWSHVVTRATSWTRANSISAIKDLWQTFQLQFLTHKNLTIGRYSYINWNESLHTKLHISIHSNIGSQPLAVGWMKFLAYIDRNILMCLNLGGSQKVLWKFRWIFWHNNPKILIWVNLGGSQIVCSNYCCISSALRPVCV